MSWYSYHDAREQKAELRREMARRQKKGEKFEALSAPAGNKKLVHTFWGKAWCSHLESHSDYEYRLPRGRSYLRQGNVYNLVIEPGVVTAKVAGSSLYDVRVTFQPLGKSEWTRIKADCAGQVNSLLDLLAGKLGDGVLRSITDIERGLFPKPREIRFSCSCPDYADLCKHVAATLYGVGVHLETKPELFFTLRSVDPSELLADTAHETLDVAKGVDAALAGEDLSALFGIEFGGEEVEFGKAPAKKPKAMRPAKTKRPEKAKAPKAPKAGAKKAARGKGKRPASRKKMRS